MSNFMQLIHWHFHWERLIQEHTKILYWLRENNLTVLGNHWVGADLLQLWFWTTGNPNYTTTGKHNIKQTKQKLTRQLLTSFYKPFVHVHSCIFSNKMPNMQFASNKLTYFTHKKCLLRRALALVTPHEHRFKSCEKCTLKLLGIA